MCVIGCLQAKTGILYVHRGRSDYSMLYIHIYTDENFKDTIYVYNITSLLKVKNVFRGNSRNNIVSDSNQP